MQTGDKLIIGHTYQVTSKSFFTAESKQILVFVEDNPIYGFLFHDELGKQVQLPMTRAYVDDGWQYNFKELGIAKR